jgi:hypothetical protein
VTAARTRFLLPAAAIGVYAAIAVLAFYPVAPLSGARLIGCGCSDAAQETWFLAWPAYAVAHAANPFFSSLLDYPHGVNLADNTSMPLLGLVAAPITWLAGPVAAFNAMLRLAFVASATSMFFVVRHLVRWWPAAFVAGLLYAFSPFMIGETQGHLFLTFVPLPPLILLCLWEIGRREEGSVTKWAIGLGLLSAAQFLISIEVLVITAVAGGVVMLAAAVTHPTATRLRWRRVGTGLGLATLCLVPVAAYPIWFFFEGARHIVGPPHSVASISFYKGDLLSSIVPTRNELLGPSHLIAIGNSFADRDTPENGVYLGVLLIVALVALTVRYRRDALVATAATLCAVGFIFSLGSPLLVDGHNTHIPLPFWLVGHLPVVKGIVAIRFSLIDQLGAAVLLGAGLACLRSEPWWASHRRLAAGGTVIAVALVLLPLLPRLPYQSSPAPLPAYFTSSVAASIPRSSVILTYPFDVDPVDDAMLWQASAGMRFAIFGGQASVPGRNGFATSILPDPPAAPVVQLFLAAFSGHAVVNGRGRPGQGAKLPPLDAATGRSIVAFCRHYGVGAVVVYPIGDKPRLVEKYLSAAFGRRPQSVGGVEVWYGLDGVAGRW